MFQCDVILDSSPDLMVFRFPSNLDREKISSIESKPKNSIYGLTTQSDSLDNKNKTYSSRKLVSNAPLVAAQFQSDGLHLKQINSSHEFKRCLNHLNSTSKNRLSNEEVKSIDTPETSKVSAVTMRFAGADEEEKRRIREGTMGHHREVVGREKSIELHYKTLPNEEENIEAKTELMET